MRIRDWSPDVCSSDLMLADKTKEKGLLIVHTGKGKGKSTAAFGLVFRALGNGMRVGIVQFVKGKWETGERTALERFGDQVTVKAMGEGFTWDTQRSEEHTSELQSLMRISYAVFCL